MELKNEKAGFTLVELLIVMGILAVLSTATILILNPADFIARANDSRRLNDLQSLNQALTLYNLRAQAPSFGLANTVYISLPNTLSDCTGSPSYTLPPLPSGFTSYACSTDANYKKVDGSGWIPVDFTSLNQDNPLAALPVDPINDTSKGFYYTYVTGGSWELTAMLQSVNNHSAAVGDGGPMPGTYEVGNDLTLGPANRDLGLVGYWKFDEGALTTANDSSGKGNNGTLEFGASWQSGATCKSSFCVLFDGVDDRVTLNPSFIIPNQFSVSFWMKLSAIPSIDWVRVIDQADSGPQNGSNFNFGSVVSGENDNLKFTVQNGASYEVTIMSGNLVAGTWYHMVGTYEKNSAKFYIDSNLIGTDSNCTMGVPSATFTMGRRSGGTNPFSGYLDDVRVYNRVLSEAEVQAIYYGTK